MSSPVVSSRTPVGQIINRDGTATFAFLKWMQNIGTTINVTFDSDGNFQGAIGDQATIDGREFLATIVQHLDNDGVMESDGIDFARIYINQNTDYIADGAGSPLAGGKAAYIALVASSPVAGQTIRFNGTDWLPVAIAITKGAVTKQWIRSYDAATGTFTASQPDFSDLSGTLNPAQLPATIAYINAANIFTANQTINANLTVTGTINGVTQATFAFLDPTSSVQTQLNSKQATITLTTTGTSGAATLTGATLNIPVYAPPVAQVYPAVGIGVSTGSAWGTSIDPNDVPRKSTANTFASNQTINGNLKVFTGITVNGLASAAANTLNIQQTSSLAIFDMCGPSVGTAGEFYFRTQDSAGGTQSNALHLSATVAVFTGTITAAGKSFRIPHPLDDSKDLVHSCLEGPEWGVYYRGEIVTANGTAEVTLPDYFEALTYAEDRTVQLTQVFEDGAVLTMLAASRIVDGKFTVHSSAPIATVAWQVQAVRRFGDSKLKVVTDKA